MRTRKNNQGKLGRSSLENAGPSLAARPELLRVRHVYDELFNEGKCHESLKLQYAVI